MKCHHALLALAFLHSFNAVAFVPSLNSSGDARKWKLDPPVASVHTNVVNRATRAVRYFLAADGYSATNTEAELNALRASFAQWQSVPGTVLKFEDAGTVAPGVDINTSDDTNVLFWAKSSTLVNGGTDNIANILGFTVTSFFSDNTLAEADIAFNGVQYAWFTDFNNSSGLDHFVEGVALHEIGHFIGLRHSPVGGATMLWRGAGGVNLQAGLSPDEFAAAKWLYAPSSGTPSLGRFRGTVTMNGSPVFCAAVVAEESSSGNMIAGTVTLATGAYDLPALPPGTYALRVTPLDPSTAGSYLVRGRDIHADFSAAETAFLPVTNAPLTLSAGQTRTLNLIVQAGAPTFRITHVRSPSSQSGSFSWSSAPTTLRPGQSNLFIGVGSASLPTAGATLHISGDGLTPGAPLFQNAGGLNFISVPISVASNATPGLRSFRVQSGSDLAYANGFLEILPLIPDHNFDGFDDRFQRQHFPLFTAAQAGPSADPDADGYNNQAEYISGTNPTNALSLLKIETVSLDAGGSTITWQSGSGRRYQVWSRRDVANDPWQTVGSPVLATGALTQFTDSSATNGFRFYRVQALP